MGKLNYGASCIMGNFGSGKTKKSFEEAYSVDDNTFVIANVPYSRVDLFYSTEDELLKVVKLLESYCLNTNANIKEYGFVGVHQQKDILFLIDEAHLYFDSRSSLISGNNMESMKLLLTQCRKRKIRMVFITQRLTQIDIRIRRLADFVEEYHRGNFLGVHRVKKSVYENRGDIADIETDTSVKYTNEGVPKNYKDEAKLYSELVPEFTTVLKLFAYFSVPHRLMLKEFYNTYYICGQSDDRVVIPSLEKFLLEILNPPVPVLPLSQVVRNNLPTFCSLYDKLYTLCDKSLEKFIKLLDTKGDKEDKVFNIGSLPNNKEDLQDIPLKRFGSLDLDCEKVVEKQLTLKEKLSLLHKN